MHTKTPHQKPHHTTLTLTLTLTLVKPTPNNPPHPFLSLIKKKGNPQTDLLLTPWGGAFPAVPCCCILSTPSPPRLKRN